MSKKRFLSLCIAAILSPMVLLNCSDKKASAPSDSSANIPAKTTGSAVVKENTAAQPQNDTTKSTPSKPQSKPVFLKIGEAFALDDVHEVAYVAPPAVPTRKQQSLAEVMQQKPTLFLFLDMGNPASDKAASEFVQATARAQKYTPVVIAYGRDPQHVEASLNALADIGVRSPIIIDDTRYFAYRLTAFRPPQYAILSADGQIKVNKISALDNPILDGRSLRQVLGSIELGGEIPVSDGEMRRDISTMTGQSAGDFEVEAAKVGKAPHAVYNLEKLKSGGKPALVVFWIATCPHCQREMPRIWSWYKKHRDEVELVTITRLDQPNMLNYTTSYLAKKSLEDLPVYAGDQGDFKAFRVEGFPSWAMVSAQGVVVTARSGEDQELSNSLDTALAKAK